MATAKHNTHEPTQPNYHRAPSLPMPMPLSIPLKLPPFPYGLLSYLLPGRLTSPSNTPPPPPTKISSSPSWPAGQQDTAEEPARVFELFDRDGDGRITREELAESLGRLGIPVPAGDELASVIERVDADGDGCVDAAEFGELYRAMMAKEGEEEVEGEMREAFRVFDADGDGYITAEELGAVLAALGMVRQGGAAEDCRRMIGRVDLDGDGRVDFHEFLQMMRDAGGFAALG